MAEARTSDTAPGRPRRMLGGIVLALGLGALALGPLACGDTAPDDHPGRGVVTGVDPAARTVSIDHEDIPGLMQAMTMTFELAPDVSLEGIEPGAAVEFRLRREGSVYTVTRLTRAGEASGP